MHCNIDIFFWLCSEFDFSLIFWDYKLDSQFSVFCSEVWQLLLFSTLSQNILTIVCSLTQIGVNYFLYFFKQSFKIIRSVCSLLKQNVAQNDFEPCWSSTFTHSNQTRPLHTSLKYLK